MMMLNFKILVMDAHHRRYAWERHEIKSLKKVLRTLYVFRSAI